MKKAISIVMALCVAVVFCFTIQTEQVNAERDITFVKYAKKITIVKYALSGDLAHNYNNYVINMGAREKNADDVWVSIKKKSVAEGGGVGSGWAQVKPKKPGTTKATIMIKKNNKVKKYKTEIRVVKYSNPFKSFKIGKKNYSKKFVKPQGLSWFTEINVPAGKAKLDIKPKRGWKVKKIYYDNGHSERAVKNKTKLNFKTINDDSNGMLQVKMYNKKKKYNVDIFILLI